ncbi:EutN/CcmL family microcompartment protein [bacterium]|nr:EutN/CcmL family microcompartment protein [bacterium]
MKLARVIGNVVASIKDPSLLGEKLMVIQPLDDNLKNVGGLVVAVDTVQAGPGDLVYYVLSREAALALKEPFSPVDASICGIVDDIYSVGIPTSDDVFEKE